MTIIIRPDFHPNGSRPDGTGDNSRIIEVFADIWCPFAHVGLRRVVARRALIPRPEMVLGIRAWPLELVNGRPLDPDTTAHHVHDLRAQAAPDLFAHFDPDHFPTTTLPALACAHAAYRYGTTTGEAVSLALRDALFEQGLDISRPAVLADIAGAWGVAPYGEDAALGVLDDWHEGIKRGVQGSPHFFCGDRDAFCPSLDISREEGGHLEINPDLGALDDFLGGCFGS
jgi:2-hydroxychromene-2-carboxylate isomerase